MALPFKTLERRFRVRPGRRVRLADHDPGWHGIEEHDGLDKGEIKARAADILAANVRELAAAQELLYASDTYSVLIVFQAMDAAGKDGTIKHVMSGINPQGCQVFSFKHPSAEELDHDFLWRYARALPERGRFGIFNRSYYEDVLVVRVHPEILEAQRLPPGKRGEKFWRGRYDDINGFERHLARSGTVVIKFFLHLSKDEQERRFRERLDRPDKHWKFSLADMNERQYWDAYETAYERMLAATSTKWAPWWIVPADHKWITRTVVSSVIVHTIAGLGLRYPVVTREKKRQLARARAQLDAGGAGGRPKGDEHGTGE